MAAGIHPQSDIEQPGGWPIRGNPSSAASEITYMRLFSLRWSAPAALLAPVLLLSACSDSAPPPAPAVVAPATLYDRIGGQPAIQGLVDDFTATLLADKRVNRAFRKANIANFKSQLSDQLCQAAGGPCTYAGRPMKDVHKGMGITDAQFNAMTDDFQKSMNNRQIAEADQADLLAAIGQMRPDIVKRAAKQPAKAKKPAAKPAAKSATKPAG